MNELISRKEAIRAIENIVAVGTFVEGMKEKCLMAVKDVPVIDIDYTDRGIMFYFEEDGTANVLNEDYVIYCANEETLEMVKEAVDKNSAKPIKKWNGQASCPSCQKLLCGNIEDISPEQKQSHCFCSYCGQKIDWSETK